MTKHVLSGIRPEPLASYLAGLGLIRALGDQADRELTSWWDSTGLVLETTVGDPAVWLAESFVPTPVLRPWNYDSDFGLSTDPPTPDLRRLISLPDPRLDPYRETTRIAIQAATRGRARATWSAEQVAREFRNSCPLVALAWIDAAAVLANRRLEFPTLLGTGGNDARFDFSNNLHSHLVALLDESSPIATKRALLARDMLYGTEVERLTASTIGQFDPAAAGTRNASPFGEGISLINPWRFVLMLEGAMMFAAAACRRHQHGPSAAAIPFTVTHSPEGWASGAEAEETRDEVWAPLWDRPFGHMEVRQVFAEARGAWRGRSAERAVEFYAATRTLGTARGLSGFVRYAFPKRNGRAHVAVPVEVVRVANRPAVALAGAIEDWVRRARRGETGAAIEQAGRRYDRAYLAFAKNGDPLALGRLLACVTDLEMAVGRNRSARETVPVRRPPAAQKFLDFLASAPSPEMRVAVGIASCRTLPGPAPERTMRHLLLPVDPGVTPQWRDSPVVAGLGLRPLPRLLAEVLAWRARTAPGEQAAQDEASKLRGVRTFRHGIAVPDSDLHRFARGQLDAELLMMWLKAGLALDWRRTRHSWPADALPTRPVPLLAMLHALAAGIAQTGADGDDAMALALEPDWPVRLAAGQLGEVHDEASRRLGQAGLRVAAPRYQGSEVSGVDIAAALVPRCQHPRRVLLSVAAPLRPHEEHGEQEISITGTDVAEVEPESEEEIET